MVFRRISFAVLGILCINGYNMAAAQTVPPTSDHLPDQTLNGLASSSPDTPTVQNSIPPISATHKPGQSVPDNWIFSQGSPDWLFFGGPVNSAHTLVRLESTMKNGQLALSCSNDGVFDLVIFPTFGGKTPPKAGDKITASVEIDGVDRSLDLVAVGGSLPGYLAAGRAVPAIALALADVPDSKVADMRITIDGIVMHTLLPSPRSIAVLTSNLCTQWYNSAVANTPAGPVSGK
jgi:hypothetical protein